LEYEAAALQAKAQVEASAFRALTFPQNPSNDHSMRSIVSSNLSVKCSPNA
jgi:hypothetical protein